MTFGPVTATWGCARPARTPEQPRPASAQWWRVIIVYVWGRDENGEEYGQALSAIDVPAPSPEHARVHALIRYHAVGW